jgi:hypothetical protein
MPDRTVNMVFARFQGLRSYVWEIILLVVILAFAIDLVGSDIYDSLKGVRALVVSIFLIFICVAYIAYAQVRANKYSVDIAGFFILHRSELSLLDIPEYRFASDFHDTYGAISAENPVFERQWRDEFARRPDGKRRTPSDFRLATEISEYIILELLSIHLTDYFNTDEFAEDRVEELSRSDIPDVLLSNRVLELISRDLQDRPWYKPDVAGPSDRSDGETVAIYGPGGIFSRFDLTLPKGSKVQRSKSGSLIIASKMLTLELNARCDGFGYGTPLFLRAVLLQRRGP